MHSTQKQTKGVNKGPAFYLFGFRRVSTGARFSAGRSSSCLGPRGKYTSLSSTADGSSCGSFG